MAEGIDTTVKNVGQVASGQAYGQQEELDQFTVMQDVPVANLNAVDEEVADSVDPTEDGYSMGAVGNGVQLIQPAFPDDMAENNELKRDTDTQIESEQPLNNNKTEETEYQSADQQQFVNISNEPDAQTPLSSADVTSAASSDAQIEVSPVILNLRNTLQDDVFQPEGNEAANDEVIQTESDESSDDEITDLVEDDVEDQVNNEPDNEDNNKIADKDRGHGNDADGVDEDNPGQGIGGPNGNGESPANTGTEAIVDNDNGHGNDVDGVDESNPGQGIGGPNGSGESPANTGSVTNVDDDNGHGNDIDGVDESNPGQGIGGPNGSGESPANTGSVTNVDDDNGHGKDIDGVDESNPGQGIGGPNSQNQNEELEIDSMLADEDGSGWQDMITNAEISDVMVSADMNMGWVDAVENNQGAESANQNVGANNNFEQDADNPLGDIYDSSATDSNIQDSDDYGLATGGF